MTHKSYVYDTERRYSAALQALRRCNGAECDLSVLGRRISVRILQLRRSARGLRLSA